MLQASEIFEYYAKQFPGAHVIASSFEDYYTRLELAIPNLELPVYSHEIGDSWIFGEDSSILCV